MRLSVELHVLELNYFFSRHLYKQHLRSAASNAKKSNNAKMPNMIARRVDISIKPVFTI